MERCRKRLQRSREPAPAPPGVGAGAGVATVARTAAPGDGRQRDGHRHDDGCFSGRLSDCDRRHGAPSASGHDRRAPRGSDDADCVRGRRTGAGGGWGGHGQGAGGSREPQCVDGRRRRAVGAVGDIARRRRRRRLARRTRRHGALSGCGGDPAGGAAFGRRAGR